jgi:hypothetical protein
MKLEGWKQIAHYMHSSARTAPKNGRRACQGHCPAGRVFAESRPRGRALRRAASRFVVTCSTAFILSPRYAYFLFAFGSFTVF